MGLLLEFYQSDHARFSQSADQVLDLGVLERLDFETVTLATKLGYLRILRCLTRGFIAKGLGLGDFPEQVKTHLKRVQEWQDSAPTGLFEKCHELLKGLQMHSMANPAEPGMGEEV